MYGLFKTLDLSTKIELLEKKIKRTYYNGRPTRKFRKLLQLSHQAGIHFDIYQKFEKG